MGEYDDLLARADRYRDEHGIFGPLLRDLASALRAQEARAVAAETALAATDGVKRHLLNRAVAAETALAAAHNVIRRLRDGWLPIEEPIGEETFDRWYLESGMDDGPETGDGTEPMTAAEVEAFHAAALLDVPDQPNPDEWCDCDLPTDTTDIGSAFPHRVREHVPVPDQPNPVTGQPEPPPQEDER